MPQPMLDAFDGLPGVALVPMPVEVLGHEAELDDEVAGQVLRLDLAAFLPPEAEQGGLVVAHDDPGVRAADERAAVRWRSADLWSCRIRHVNPPQSATLQSANIYIDVLSALMSY